MPPAPSGRNLPPLITLIGLCYWGIMPLHLPAFLPASLLIMMISTILLLPPRTQPLGLMASHILLGGYVPQYLLHACSIILTVLSPLRRHPPFNRLYLSLKLTLEIMRTITVLWAFPILVTALWIERHTPNFALSLLAFFILHRPFSTPSVSPNSTTWKYKVSLTVPSTNLVCCCLIWPKLSNGLTPTGSCMSFLCVERLFGFYLIAVISSLDVVSFIKFAPPSALHLRYMMALTWVG